MAKEKPDQASDLTSPDKIKKELDDTSTTPASKPLVASRSISILTSPPNSSTRTSGGGRAKTVLLVQTVSSRTGGGIQSLLLPQALRSSGHLPSPASPELTVLSSRAKMSAMLTTSSKSQLGTAAASEGKLVTCPASQTPLQSLQSPAQASHSQIQSSDVESIMKLTRSSPAQQSTCCELIFKSRTIKADGTVSTLKEYLCNFCQFMVASQDEFREHFMTHIFSCNYCSFRAFTRFEVLSHKREKHLGIAEELAGYEGLNDFSDQLNSVIGDWNSAEMPPKAGPPPLPGVSIQVPIVSCPMSGITIQRSATETVDSDGSPASTAPSKTSASQRSIQTFPTSTPVTVASTPSLTTSLPVTVAASTVSTMTSGLLAQKPDPVMLPGTRSSPVIISTSTIKTPASVGKSNDNYFTYKVVHNAAGKVQAYECDVCNYNSTKVNEILAHASTHTMNDLKKSNGNSAQWECFYCSFASVLQVNVVSHVMAKHPDKPIQLKRMLSNNPTERFTSRSILFRNPNFISDATTTSVKTVSPSIDREMEKSSDDTAVTAPTNTTTDIATRDGCMWGCYYCSVQSVDRNEIIVHLKKDHAMQKLVITRRRIMCIPAPQSAKDTACRLKKTVGPQQSNSEDEKTNGDVDSTDPQHSLLKSKRKQVLPCKVPDDLVIDGVIQSDETTKSSFQAVLPFNKCKRRFDNWPKSKEFTDLSELKMSEVVVKRSRSATDVGGSLKRIALNREIGKIVDLTDDLEENATIVVDGQEVVGDVGMPALEDVSNFAKLKEINRKSSAAASKEPHFAPADSISSFIINEMAAENEMPTLHPELSIKKQLLKKKVCNDPESSSSSSSSTGNIGQKHPLEGASKPVDLPDDFVVSDSQLFCYSSVTSEASCERCSVVMSGPNARNRMREHCMSHTGGQLWKCPYCPFKCGRRGTIARHVRRRHKGRPLNAIQRKVYPRRSSVNGFEIDSSGMVGGKPPKGKRAVSKLRGPRSVKESRAVEWVTRVWECPFCGRQSLFKGSVIVHIKVAHPSEDSEVKVKRLPRTRPDWNSTAVNQKPVINIVPIESMHLYDSLATLLLDNGTSLKYDLDIDDDMDDNGTVVDRTGLRYQCSHCSFRNLTPQVIKIHILGIHPGESMTVLDHLSGCRSRRLFLCNSTNCCFATSKVDKLKMHACKLTETEKPVVAAAHSNGLNGGETPVRAQDISEMGSQLSGISFRPSTQCNDQGNTDDDNVILSVPKSNVSKSTDISSSESQHNDSFCFFSSSFHKRIKTTEGPIDYNDDGTLKGVDLGTGSLTLQCQYCDYPNTSDPVEIKAHLASEHPRLQPIAVDVDLKEKGGFSSLFICSVFGCDYSSRFSNVFEHHVNIEHPEDVEGKRSVRKKCTQKRNASEKFQLQDEVPDQNYSLAEEQLNVEENAAQNAPELTDDDDCAANSAPLPTAAIASPAAAAAFSPSSALSPVGTLCSDASSAIGDSPAADSPDAIQISDSPFPTKDDAVRPGRKLRKRNKYVDFACRYECIQCSFRVGSPEEMKGHLVAKHRENFRSFYCIDRRARQLRKRQKIIFCRDSRCRFHCKLNEELENHEKYTCSFSPSVRPHHQRATKERLLRYVDPVVVKMNHGADGEKPYDEGVSGGGSAAAMLDDDVNNKMYQCSHCTFITTDLHSIRMHVIAEHASTEGGFTEIKTELGTDGNVVMNVNDRGVHRLSRVDDEEKVYTVL